MLSVAICDDQKNIRTYLSSLVKEQGTECEITEYASADEYLSECREHVIHRWHDLLFLDIEMSDDNAADKNGMCKATYKSGMWLAEQLRSMKLAKQPIIIFVTGHEKYVYDAFDVGAFQYLLKPIDEQKFAEVFKRAVGQIAAGQNQQREVSCQRTLIVPYANDKRAIALTDIYYMESQGHKIVLYLKNEKLEYYAKIGELEKELQGQFYRIHKGYLINLSHVEGYNKTEVTMTNGDKLLISKYKYDDFRNAYVDFISEG